MQLVQSFQRDDRIPEVEKPLRKISMLPLLPVLSSFLFVGIHRLHEPYFILRVGPLHVPLLGVSKMLNDCLKCMVGDVKRTTDVFKDAIV